MNQDNEIEGTTQLTKHLEYSFKVRHEFAARNVKVEFEISKDSKFMFPNFFRVHIQFIVDSLKCNVIQGNHHIRSTR